MIPFSPIIQKPSIEIVSRKRQLRRAGGKGEELREGEPDACRGGGRALVSQHLEWGFEPRLTSCPCAGLQVTCGLQVADSV